MTPEMLKELVMFDVQTQIQPCVCSAAAAAELWANAFISPAQTDWMISCKCLCAESFGDLRYVWNSLENDAFLL